MYILPGQVIACLLDLDAFLSALDVEEVLHTLVLARHDIMSCIATARFVCRNDADLPFGSWLQHHANKHSFSCLHNLHTLRQHLLGSEVTNNGKAGADDIRSESTS